VSSLGILGAFVRRDWAVAISYRFPFALQAFSGLLSIAFLYYLARIVDASSVDTPDLEAGYFGFAVLGVVLLGVFQAGLGAVSSRFRQEQTTGTLEVLLASPAPRWALLYGGGVYEILRESVLAILAVLFGVVVFGLALHASVASALVALAAVFGALCLFASLGVLVAAFTVAFKQNSALVDPLVTVIALLAGTYFPVDVLPGPIENVANFLPLTWVLEVIRQALLFGDSEVGLLLAVLATAAASIPLSLWVFSRAVAYARRNGSLSHY
jgi:ABC-2 type transport system permease protein